MNKMEANISLFVITLFAAIQYVFLAWVPESVSRFAFLCVTNLAGFLMTLAFFFGELFRLDKKQMVQSIVLSLELIVFNVSLMMGVSGVGPTVTAAVLSVYFVFIVALSMLLLHQAHSWYEILGSAVILLGLFFMMDANIAELWNRHILYLLIADLAFALFILTTGRYAESSNPAILAMGQMLFCFLFALVGWVGEAAFLGQSLSLSKEPAFWASVLFISLFIRGLYGIVQVYAQRYVTPLSTSLIFSTEIVITLFVSPLLTRLFGTAPEKITPLRVAGSVIILLGVLIAEPTFLQATKNWALSGKLPGKAQGKTVAKPKRKVPKHYFLYSVLCATLLGVCGLAIGDVPIALTYMTVGALAGIPVAILLDGVLHVGFLADRTPDAAFRIEAGAESLNNANDAMEQAALGREISRKRVFETQNCVEELSIRILNAQPDSVIDVRVQYGDAISAWMSWGGEKYNPLYIGANEDEIDVAGLKLIKHRALQASFSRRGGENRLHVVV